MCSRLRWICWHSCVAILVESFPNLHKRVTVLIVYINPHLFERMKPCQFFIVSSVLFIEWGCQKRYPTHRTIAFRLKSRVMFHRWCCLYNNLVKCFFRHIRILFGVVNLRFLLRLRRLCQIDATVSASSGASFHGPVMNIFEIDSSSRATSDAFVTGPFLNSGAIVNTPKYLLVLIASWRDRSPKAIEDDGLHSSRLSHPHERTLPGLIHYKCPGRQEKHCKPQPCQKRYPSIKTHPLCFIQCCTPPVNRYCNNGPFSTVPFHH